MQAEFKNEEAFQRLVIEAARYLQWRVAHFRKVRVARPDGSTYWQTPVQADGEGFPDLILVHRASGRIIAAELKMPGNKPTKEQKLWLALFGKQAESYLWYPDDWRSGAIQFVLEAA